MIRFDFLHDSRPELVDAVRSARLPRRLHNVAVAIGAIVLSIATAAAIERVRCADAHNSEERAQARFEASRAELNKMQLQWQQLDALIAQDRKLRAIRLSGPAAAARIAILGNVMVDGAWLTSLTADRERYDLKGRAVNVAVFGNVLARVVTGGGVEHPDRVTVSREKRNLVSGVSFEIAAGDAR